MLDVEEMKKYRQQTHYPLVPKVINLENTCAWNIIYLERWDLTNTETHVTIPGYGYQNAN